MKEFVLDSIVYAESACKFCGNGTAKIAAPHLFIFLHLAQTSGPQDIRINDGALIFFSA